MTYRGIWPFLACVLVGPGLFIGLGLGAEPGNAQAQLSQPALSDTDRQINAHAGGTIEPSLPLATEVVCTRAYGNEGRECLSLYRAILTVRLYRAPLAAAKGRWA